MATLARDATLKAQRLLVTASRLKGNRLGAEYGGTSLNRKHMRLFATSSSSASILTTPRRIPCSDSRGGRTLPRASTMPPNHVSRANFVSQTIPVQQSSPFDPKNSSSPPPTTKSSPAKPKRKRKAFVPTKAAVQLTPKARKFFTLLLENAPEGKTDIMLHYDQSSSGQPRMVFSFDFVSAADLGPFDEGVSLQVLDDGVTPKAPADSLSDGLPKLYVSGNAFLKVLGATLDVDTAKMAPLLYDKEGNRMDPNN